MKAGIWAAVLTAVWLSAPGAASAADYPALFEKVWSTVDENFYDPAFHGVDWKAVGARYRVQLGGVHDDKAFEALASAMLKEIGTSHIYIVPPQGSSASGAGIGVRFQEIGGDEIVWQIAPLSDAAVRPGDKLLSPRTALTGAIGTEAKARIEDCAGHAREITAHRIGAFWPPPHPAFEWSTAKVGEGRRIGYLRIDRFDDGAAGLADRAMAELHDTSALIVDIRANTGGNASAVRLLSYFSGSSAPNFALFARPYLAQLDRGVTRADVLGAAKVTGAYTDEAIFAAVSAHRGAATFWSEDMGGKRYAGPVVVLIGGDTGSAAEGFAWGMHSLGQARFVGRTTAGALLSAQDFDLPGGWTLTIPVQGVWGPDGADYRDRAVAPDIAVTWTRADMCSGRDPDIEAAMAVLGR